MIPPDDNAAAPPERGGLVLLVVIISLAFGWILLPFYGTVLWGAVVALIFAPMYRSLLVPLRGRRTLAALLTLAIVMVIVVIPFALIMVSLTREATLLYGKMQSGQINPALYFHGLFDAFPPWLMGLLGRLGVADFDSLQRRLSVAVVQGMQFVATHALSIGQNTFAFVASLFISLYLAFFLIRDGDGIVRAVRRAIPLADAHKQELLTQFTMVIRATVKGNLLVAVVQGALGGLAFWFLGINAALLWAVLMAFLSLLPAVGAGLVWLPVAIYLLLTGAIWQSVTLVVYGTLVIGLIDNLLRPLLVGKDTRMPDYVVMMSTLGGMAVFGLSGFIIGPTIAAMFIAAWQIYGRTRGATNP